MAKPQSAEEAEGTRIPRLTERIIGAAIEVHRHTGPGLMESAYEECLSFELSQSGLTFTRQVPLPVTYKSIKLDCRYKMDLVVEDTVVLELKTADQLLPIHTAQLLTYLKLSGKPIGLLINFNEPVLKKGLKRLVNHFSETGKRQVPSAPSARESGDRTKPPSVFESLKTQRLSVSAVNRLVTYFREPLPLSISAVTI